MRTKSLGLAIVLTLFFGPIGLFYASITGGLIMCCLPVLLFLLFIFGAVTESTFLLAGSLMLLVVFFASYWIICTIWAATAVSNHNNKVADSKRTAEFLNRINKTQYSGISGVNPRMEKSFLTQGEHSNTKRPTLQDWRKNNYHCSINDYYRIYGVPTSTMTSNNIIQPQIQKETESSNILFNIAGITAILLVIFAVLSYDKEIKTFNIDKISNLVNLSNDKKEIENQIENVYFGLTNGVFTLQSLSGTTPDNLPFYNSNLSTLLTMGFAPLTMIGGSSFSLEPKNIKIDKMYDNKADVNYDLVMTDDGKVTTIQISMTLKKIGGKWKLDGQKFLPFKEEKNTKRKKY